MSEKPIIFSGPMVRAILTGRKTQTRRVKKKEIPPYSVGDLLWVRETWQEFFDDELPPDRCRGPCGLMGAGYCPERFSFVFYRADGEVPDHPEYGKALWRSPIHMPRSAARIFLRVTDVRLEMLQDIGEDDAKKEGVDGIEPGELFFNFMTLWEAINAKRDYGWETNPWVWVISFEVVAEAKNVTPHL